VPAASSGCESAPLGEPAAASVTQAASPTGPAACRVEAPSEASRTRAAAGRIQAAAGRLEAEPCRARAAAGEMGAAAGEEQAGVVEEDAAAGGEGAAAGRTGGGLGLTRFEAGSLAAFGTALDFSVSSARLGWCVSRSTRVLSVSRQTPRAAPTEGCPDVPAFGEASRE
jgi:hypothetical protein